MNNFKWQLFTLDAIQTFINHLTDDHIFVFFQQSSSTKFNYDIFHVYSAKSIINKKKWVFNILKSDRAKN